jgi:hypothetical protein
MPTAGSELGRLRSTTSAPNVVNWVRSTTTTTTRGTNPRGSGGGGAHRADLVSDMATRYSEIHEEQRDVPRGTWKGQGHDHHGWSESH